MKVFGLTGGIGMGKSTADKILRECGVPVVDTDLLARQVVEPGQPALAEIRQAFGTEMIDDQGCLRREELARRVFNDPAALKQLEGMLHPRIRLLWQQQVENWRAEGQTRVVVVIPLLFETDARANFDATICIACSAASQIERLQTRGWNRDQIETRIRAQWPVQKKMELANYVVWTEGSMEVHAEQLRRIIP
ncbi:MAG: dephospho-CoA kinase [Pedosphaera sp.]|nr:dephospho-CoA kinase [Pedosphaera sp.]